MNKAYNEIFKDKVITVIPSRSNRINDTNNNNNNIINNNNNNNSRVNSSIGKFNIRNKTSVDYVNNIGNLGTTLGYEFKLIFYAK